MSDLNIVDWSVRELFAPIEILPGLVVCVDDVEPPRDGSAVIFLKRGESFGTGAHPATRAIIYEFLGYLSWVNDDNRHMLEGRRLLDYNCGTGLIALIAKAVFPEMEVLAVADKKDHWTAGENMTLNHATEEIGVRSMPSFRRPGQLKRSAGTFDYIITQAADPAIELMANLMSEEGVLFYGGHNAQIHHPMKNRIEQFFNVLNVDDMLGWPVIRAEKKPPANGGHDPYR